MSKRRFNRWGLEFAKALDYVRDPHGWEQRRRRAVIEKFVQRPAIFQTAHGFVVHPALERELRARMMPPTSGSNFPSMLYGPSLFVSLNAVQYSPPEGWPDIAVPERPEWAP